MSRPAPWAFSGLDYAAHLLLYDGDHSPGVHKARCGELLPTVATKFDHPVGRVCPVCELIARADLTAPVAR